MRYFSVFSGVAGFEIGIGDKGECVGFSEIDRWASMVLKYHFPNIKNYGDITKISPSELPDFDLLVGGFPCQSFSIAGKRGGFKDTRGTLFFEIARIAKVKRPPLLLLENVKGLLNHDKGNTFATIISTLDELGYDCQWSVLNSKNFGVPQNRERVFIVGQRRDIDKIQVFPIMNYRDYYEEIIKDEKVYWLSKDVSLYTKTLLLGLAQSQKQELSREQMQGLLTRTQQGIQKGECREVPRNTEALDTDTERGIQIVEELNSWTSCQNKSGEICGMVQIPTEEMLLLWLNGKSTSISFRQIQQQDLSFECGQNRLVKGLRRGEYGSLLFAVQPYQGRLFYSIGNGRDWQKIYSTEVEKICNPTLNSILEERPDQKYFLSENMMKGLLRRAEGGGNSASIQASYRKGVNNQNQLVYEGAIMSEKNKKWLEDGKELSRNFPQGQRVYSSKGIATSILSQGGGFGAKTGLYAIAPNKKQIDLSEIPNRPFQITETRTEKGKQTRKEIRQKEKRDSTKRGKDDKKYIPLSQDLSNCITTGKENVEKWLFEGTRIRRLTPTECERLQAFPDGWTKFGINEKGEKVEISDSQRYKMMGNALTTNVVEQLIKTLF